MTKKHTGQTPASYPDSRPHFRSRRDFLRTASALVGGLLAGGCLPGEEDVVTTTPLSTSDSPGHSGARPTVALVQANNYDREVVRERVSIVLDELGGLGDVVSPGDRVVIKTNLTGGMALQPEGLPSPASEIYITHPEVVRALGEAVLEADAREVYIVEAVFDDESFSEWGYEEIAAELGATLIDLNNPVPYADFITCPVGEDRLIYEEFIFNEILADADVFMSVAKMKCHRVTGITLSMKNLVGLVPVQNYRLDAADNWRSSMHGDYSKDEPSTRIPRSVIDLTRARPIDFALIDGIKTSDFAEGPWVDGWSQVKPGVLVAGTNPVATDAVAAAVMGFDPTAKSFEEEPFLHCENHLYLASRYGLGPNNLDDIEIVGAALEEVLANFRAYSQ